VGCQQGYVFLAGITFGAVRWIRPHADLWRFMGGDHHINQSTFVLCRPFPWSGASASLCVAGLMLLGPAAMWHRREFLEPSRAAVFAI
jgi:hypothetical protein